MASQKYGQGDITKVTEDCECYAKGGQKGTLRKDTIGMICNPTLTIVGESISYGFLEACDRKKKPVQVDERYLKRLTKGDAELVRLKIDFARTKLEYAKKDMRYLKTIEAALEKAGLAATS